jgi:uracil-DNA glycosylase family 4
MKLMIIGETTGNRRSKENFSFLGTNAERYIWDELEKRGYKREDFHTYSVFSDKGHRVKSLTEEEKLEYQISFQRELLMYMPDLILSVGRIPTQELLQEKVGGQYYDLVGQLLYSQHYEVWFVPTIQPSVIARDPEKIYVLQDNLDSFVETIKEFEYA